MVTHHYRRPCLQLQSLLDVRHQVPSKSTTAAAAQWTVQWTVHLTTQLTTQLTFQQTCRAGAAREEVDAAATVTAL